MFSHLIRIVSVAALAVIGVGCQSQQRADAPASAPAPDARVVRVEPAAHEARLGSVRREVALIGRHIDVPFSTGMGRLWIHQHAAGAQANPGTLQRFAHEEHGKFLALVFEFVADMDAGVANRLETIRDEEWSAAEALATEFQETTRLLLAQLENPDATQRRMTATVASISLGDSATPHQWVSTIAPGWAAWTGDDRRLPVARTPVVPGVERNFPLVDQLLVQMAQAQERDVTSPTELTAREQAILRDPRLHVVETVLAYARLQRQIAFEHQYPALRNAVRTKVDADQELTQAEAQIWARGDQPALVAQALQGDPYGPVIRIRFAQEAEAIGQVLWLQLLHDLAPRQDETGFPRSRQRLALKMRNTLQSLITAEGRYLEPSLSIRISNHFSPDNIRELWRVDNGSGMAHLFAFANIGPGSDATTRNQGSNVRLASHHIWIRQFQPNMAQGSGVDLAALTRQFETVLAQANSERTEKP